MAETKAIPGPPPLPIVGNAFDMDREVPLQTFKAFADKYGEVYRLRFGSRSVILCNTVELVNEICDEKRFKKIPKAALAEVRNGVNDGLFTAKIEEPNWGIAHRILMPAFGPMGIRRMFDEMHDVATQMCMKFARQGSQYPINMSDDFTRLALDTLALCTMGFRFNSYYNDKMHPFIEAMGDFLTDSGRRSQRAPLPAFWYRSQDAKYWEDIGILRKTANDVLQERKTAESGAQSGRYDLLTAMLDGVDSKTGQKMTDSSIIDNLVTFLIAGHETTSGTLSFAMYRLMKNPDVFRKAQQQVDEVVGKGPITVEHMTKLPYIEAILRETLRLDSPISSIFVTPVEDTLLGGKYPVQTHENVGMFMAKSHLDPTVYGEDALEFKPERMTTDKFSALPKNAWKPFGNGARACIGRPFAWQEMVLAMAMLLQNFNFVMDDPSYDLEYKQTLTIKPKDFFARAILRDNLTATKLERRLAGSAPESDEADNKTNGAAVNNDQGQPMVIAYGSNSGTCESMAHRLAADAPRHGFKVTTLDCMDAVNGQLPKDRPVVFVTPSYEGAPADNAAHFVSWLEAIKDKSLEGVNYAVFGCGHHDWASTFHRVPKLVDSKLEEAGASRIVDMGLSDAANGDMFVDFETWEDNALWPALTEKYADRLAESSSNEDLLSVSSLKVSVTTPRVSTLRENVQEAEVISNRVLTAPGEPVKCHIEMRLPSTMSYRSGDYLAVLPINPRETVSRVMRRFELPWDAHITIEGDSLLPLPKNESYPASTIFGAYVELGQPATKRQIALLAKATAEASDKNTLNALAGDDYSAEISAKRMSVLDLLEKFPSIKLPLASFLSVVPPMRVRQYSISSSPLVDPSSLTLTFGLLDEPSKSGLGKHIGVASSYLASLTQGDKLHVAVRPSHAAFHLPSDPETTPIICVAAGTGLAPFRGFLQERAAMTEAGRKLAPALLYYGCRAPGKDDLHTEELEKWEKEGVVSVRRAYSRVEGGAQPGGCKYVQDALWEDRERVTDLWERDAKLYVCGSRKINEGVAEKAIAMAREKAAEKKGGAEPDEGKLEAWWEGLRNVRYATDVFD